MERWSAAESKILGLDALEADVTMDSPNPNPTSSKVPTSWLMVLDAHDALDTIMQPVSYSCADTGMVMDPEWIHSPTQVSIEMDWAFGMSSSWMGPTQMTADISMEEIHLLPIPEFEGGDMEGVIGHEPAEVVTTEQPLLNTDQVVVTPAESIEGEPQVVTQDAKDITGMQAPEVSASGAVDELVDGLAAMWTLVVVEDSESDGQETEEEVEEGGGTEEEEEAELEALEEEHFAAAAEDFLAGLEAEITDN
ncbi:hypothetical protein B0J17DRAFT_721708 [Rhizoctonia solani]|nr:hypothetical protein B0J17DRAFT_721708 [Rhizoctonia solani]